MPKKTRQTVVDRHFRGAAPRSEDASRAPQASPAPSALPPDGFTRWSSLKHIIPLSHESIRRRELANRFPKRVHLGSARCVAWKNSEILEWLSDPTSYRASEPAR
ncbi:MAG: AlpA family phage regulatory protein [Paraburkholderia sp.]|nr:MAG: AlpA family phage regulatory protein [Paraburkholderia sp.]